MKITVNVLRVIVGLLFIFSGLVKANDPLGLSYKMQEFFDLWEMAWLDTYSLTFSILMIAFEIVAGYALLVGWQMRLFSWLLLLLILFFTFLTGYAYFSAKFRNCGCFGDCIPISSQTSFLKDVVLTVMILFLFARRDTIRPLFGKRSTAAIMIVVTILSFGIQWYTLQYLPVVDCLPFRRGNNISQQMQKPADAVDPVTEVHFVYEKQGKEIEFTASEFPADFNDSIYHFKKRFDKVIREGHNYEAPIKSFVLNGADPEVDSAGFVLEQPWAILVACDDPGATLKSWAAPFADLVATAKQKNIPVILVSSVRETAIQAISKTPFAQLPVFSCDNVTIRTAARTNPCFYLLQKGTIRAKYSYRSIDKFASVVQGIAATSGVTLSLANASLVSAKSFR